VAHEQHKEQPARLLRASLLNVGGIACKCDHDFSVFYMTDGVCASEWRRYFSSFFLNHERGACVLSIPTN
jgi:hypothetical protein